LAAAVREEVLAAPPKHGFDLLAWVVPSGAAGRGGHVSARGDVVAERRPPPPQGVVVDVAMDARIDADLERDE
jgi:hypothetical protein